MANITFKLFFTLFLVGAVSGVLLSAYLSLARNFALKTVPVAIGYAVFAVWLALSLISVMYEIRLLFLICTVVAAFLLAFVLMETAIANNKPETVTPPPPPSTNLPAVVQPGELSTDEKLKKILEHNRRK